MLEAFLSFVKEHKLFNEEERILLAVSGGLDSVVMAHLFQRAGFRFGIAHCNFLLRGKESDGDEAFVRDLAGILGVEFYDEKFETEKYASHHKYGIQEAARLLRYNWFKDLRLQHDFAYVCTAHHSDDSIETFFVNLTRGAGIDGLRGIPMKNENVIRPLLFAGRAEILAFAEKEQLSFREDSSNANDKYLRNKIRHSLLPVLEELNPSIRKTILKEMQHISDAGMVLGKFMLEQKKACLHTDGTDVYFLLKDLEDKQPLRFYLFEWLKEFGFKEPAIVNLEEVLKKKEHAGKTFHASDYTLSVERDRLSIRKRKMTVQAELLFEKKSASYSSPIAFKTRMVLERKDFIIPNNSTLACLDADKLNFPLLLRKWREGDRFQPLGMKGSKLLSDYFSDNKFSAASKEQAWVIESRGEIAWLVEHRIDERFKVEEGTRAVFLISLG